MKQKFKIIFSILFVLAIAIILNKVSAIGNVSQAWIETSNGKRELVYRTFTSPYSTTLNNYDNIVRNNTTYDAVGAGWKYKASNNVMYTARWIKTVNNKGVTLPDAYSFRTIGLMFHKEQIGIYPSENAKNGNNAGYIYSTNLSTQKIDSIETIYNNSELRYTSAANKIGSPRFDNLIFYKIWNSNSTISDISWGTGLKASGISPNANTEYRYCIVYIQGKNNKASSNVYVGDNIVHYEYLPDLAKKVSEINQKENNKLFCYVSDAIISKSFNQDFELALSAANFFKQSGKQGYSYNFWGKGTRGFAAEGMGSVLNLFDNKIYFPQMAEREVYVRHINIGNNTVISEKIVNNGTRINPSTPYYLKLSSGNNLASYDTSKRNAYQEYFKSVPIDQGFTKTALPDPNPKTYTCIGYNVSTANSLTAAQDGINQNVRAGRFTKGNSVTVDAKSVEKESDVTVIDFYYTEYEKNVYVNHIYVDKDGNVLPQTMQTVVPNDISKEDGKTDIKRVNTDKYVLETYKKRFIHYITVRTADSLKLDIDSKKVKYYGYEIFDHQVNLNELVGKGARANLNKATTANLTSDNVQVNFYYYYDNTVEEKEPSKDIEGQVFVTKASINDISTACDDTEERTTVTSIPSGTNATVGIKGIPRYMVASITTDYESANKDKEINVTLNYKLGNMTKTVKYDKLKYRVGFYKITDMAVYKLNDMVIYDAENGEIETTGTSLFDWKSLKVNPKDVKLNIKMTGINNRVISNTNSSINDINNYVGISVTDKNGFTTGIGTTSSSLTRTYLTNKELAEVDANDDKVINDTDKQFAIEKLSSLDNIKINENNVKNQKQAIYDNEVSVRASLKETYDEASKTLNNKVKIYEEAIATLNNKTTSYENYKTDVNNAESKLEQLQKELQDLTDARDSLVSKKVQADNELQQAETRKTELNNVVQTLINERKVLQQNANCNDTINQELINIYGENVHIYMEQSEIDKLEECKEHKRKYEENLEAKLLESATDEYNSYLDNEYSKAVTNVSDLQQSIEEKDKEIADKENEVGKQELNAISARSWLATLYNDKENYRIQTSVEYGNPTFRDAKEDYESYRDNEYRIAKENYDNNIESKSVENAKVELDAAIKAYATAEENYNKYKAFEENLRAKYDEYKAKYDEFIAIDVNNPGEVADKLGLKLNINVQNMIVNVNGEFLASASSNTKTESYILSDYLKLSEIPSIKTERPVISKAVYSNIGSTFIEETDYTNESLIDSSVLNGERTLAGKAKYTLERVIGEKNAIDVVDRVYYSNQSDDDKTVVFKLKNASITKTYKIDTSVQVKDEVTRNEKYKQVEPVNIYTPISVSAKLTSNLNQVVDQSVRQDENDEVQVIQINTPFRVDFGNENKPVGYNINSTKDYNSGYYIKFDFDVHNVKINGKSYKNGNRISAGTWIGEIHRNSKDKAYIEAQPYGNTEENKVDIISEQTGNYTVRAVAYNATSVMKTRSLIYNTLDEMRNETGDLIDNICNPKSYFAEQTYAVVIINRAYDFRVTDVKDVNWKNVFRISNSINTNTHTGFLYYSGTTKWNTKSKERTNDIITRTTSEIGRNPLRILPMGPYKSSDTSYIKAPKMGYRFSYDMKVTGSYYNPDGSVNNNKKVEIKTKFYYISKAGSGFLEEYNGEGKGIYLFYKNASGKYIRIDDNGGDYELSFTPNDGYRYIEDTDTSTLSKKAVSLGNLRRILLTSNMATMSNNSSYITYYGEYKLPNSTIAVEVDENGNYNINKPLNRGYIGVIFDIVAYAGKVNNTNMLLSYSKDTNPNKPNTSQWDYEGYLAYTKYGSKLNSDNAVTIKLESGKWNINTDELYNKIKGTVMLYDIDSKAATDFD